MQAQVVHETTPQVRPWVRFWARAVDFSLFALVLGVAAGFLTPGVFSLPDFVVIFLPGVAMIPLEAVCLAAMGTTPGKWLFNIRVRTEAGQRLTLRQAFQRAVRVCIGGLGSNLPVLSLIFPILSYLDLRRDKVTVWDRQGGYSVEHAPLSACKVAMAVVWLLFFPVLFV